MATATIHQAKINLSRLIEKAERGEDVVIARGKTPVVRLVPIAKPAKSSRTAGMFRGEFQLSRAFFDAIPPSELEGWE